MATFRDTLKMALHRDIILGAVRVALVVGTLLNLINQGGAILEGLPIAWPHAFLNYLVPFCVSSYSAASNQLRIRQKGDS